MTTYCPYCGAEMTSQFSETNDLYYVEGDKRTYWDISELWACYQCPGPEE
jgi:hypothetical protein